ncbi:MAG: hypothetical protein ACXWCG_08205 [Flavitalea sp.]
MRKAKGIGQLYNYKKDDPFENYLKEGDNAILYYCSFKLTNKTYNS